MTRTPLGTTTVGRSRQSALIPLAAVAELHLVTRVGGERFAFPVLEVDEALDAPALSWVPGATDGLVGQLRHRGRTLSAYDAGWLFSVRRAATAPTALVLRDGDARVAIVVDDVEDLQLVDPESVRPVPTGVDPSGVLRGVSMSTEGDRALVGLVNVEAFLSRTRPPAAASVGGTAR